MEARVDDRKVSGRLFTTIAVAIMCLSLRVGEARAATLTVCASGCDYSDIQSAVAAAADGDTVSVAEGTYSATARIVITTGLTLQGAGAKSTIIDGGGPSNSLTGPGMIEVSANSSPVTIEGFTLRNAGSGGGEIADIVLSHPASPVTIEDNHFIGDSQSAGQGYFDNAIWVYHSTTTGTLTVSDNKFDHLWQPILLELATGGATVSGNLFDTLFSASDGTNTYEPEGVLAITYDDGGPVNINSLIEIQHNVFKEFSGLSIGFDGGYPGAGVGQFTDVRIKGNRIMALGAGQGGTPTGIALKNSDTAADGGVQNALIEHNRIIGDRSGGVGIKLVGANNNAQLLLNVISRVDTGVDLQDNGSGASEGVVARFDALTGNSAFGLNNETATGSDLVDAACNYWGNAHGPANAANTKGRGDAVSNNVTFSPWMRQYNRGQMISCQKKL